ncbi:hypothetical protein DVB69_04320 [Sporosarcina sp. BI001-red]|uniref:hypothetical protein n=1 Tax=Sporosarcina sp. BI001-red TaxID=2282866 RepID=UPI000E2653B0|nr:hypothetical protein [Sporosarcina sp. BI001-red]REB10038.1 hypothetical protein DVB69_04320 [Sporosarcina sp. BI001-red]
MIIENIIIHDYINNGINKFTFDSRVNLFVSKTNTIGKSSLMKSIYHTLGYSIKIWPSEWNAKDMIFQLNILINNERYSITRHKDLFYINGKESILNEQEYSSWLQDLLKIEIKIKSKKNKKLTNVYASEVLLPFYIDQDKSWNGYVFSKSSDSYGRYSDTVKDIFNFYFDITNNKILDLEVEKSELELKIKTIDKKGEGLALIGDEFQPKETQVYVSKVEELENSLSEIQLNNYLEKLNIINSSLAENDKEIIELDKKINILNRDLVELEKLKSSYSKRFEDIKHKCIYCNSNLTDEQSLTRLKIRNNLFEITEQTDKNKLKFNSLKLERDRKIDKKDELVSEQFTYENIVNNSREVENLIENIVKQEMFNNYVSIEQELILSKNSTIEEINTIKNSIKAEKKVGNKKRTVIRKKYMELLSQYELNLRKVKLDEIKLYNFKEVSGSGNDSNKKMLAIYILYSNLISQFSNVEIPFGMDSFIKNETSVEFKEEMFGFLSKYYLTIPSQVFFSIIDENIIYLDSEMDYNKIELERPILKEVNKGNQHLLEHFTFIE